MRDPLRKPLIALSIPLLLGSLLILANFSQALPSPEPLNYYGTSSPYSGGPSAAGVTGYISNPSIYSYTVSNQRQQQQQIRNDIGRSDFANRNYYLTNSAKDAASVGAAQPTASSVGIGHQPTQPAPLISGCTLDRLAVYKVVLHTYWTRDLFPKHYPDWRPTAQWTKTIGRTHDSSYALYHIGQQASAGVKQFSETGKTDILDSLNGEQQQLQQQQQQQKQQQKQQSTGNSFNSIVGTSSASASATIANGIQKNSGNQSPFPQAERSVFDEFNLPSILNGAGRSEAKFFVDSNHSLVSLMTRIVPSPDWFIGVDSFQLCVGGSWIDSVTVEMDPLDAGTDNGFTFTAPNWPTSPQGVIYRITSRYPAHPAGSFFYPKSKRLPPIATFQFIKLKEYELSEVFNFAEDDRKYELVKTQTHLETEHNHVEMNNELSANIERERQNEITPQPTSITERDRIRSKLLAKMNPMYNNSNNYAASSGGGSTSDSSNVIPKNDKNALMQNIANSYRRSEASASASSSSSSSTMMMKRRRSKHSRDCRVSHWSEWTPCSKTCGIGEMHRYRKVIKHGKRGGRPCPALQESKWCGSERNCHSPSTYFNWSDT